MGTEKTKIGARFEHKDRDSAWLLVTQHRHSLWNKHLHCHNKLKPNGATNLSDVAYRIVSWKTDSKSSSSNFAYHTIDYLVALCDLSLRRVSPYPLVNQCRSKSRVCKLHTTFICRFLICERDWHAREKSTEDMAVQADRIFRCGLGYMVFARRSDGVRSCCARAAAWSAPRDTLLICL